MIIKQHHLGCLARTSYFIADRGTRRAVLVDPQRDVAAYLDDARALGAEVTHVLLTEWRPATAAAACEVRDRTGARIACSATSEAGYPFLSVRDGDEIVLGTVRLVIRETPGHTPDAIAIIAFDDRHGELPQAVFTGTTLLIGDVGRPDSVAWAPFRPSDAAESLYDSLHATLLALPDETLVYPSHGAGALCGRALSTELVSTIGAQRRYNFALQPMTRAEFVRTIAADERAVTADAAAAPACITRWTLPELLAGQREGAQIVDARDPLDFAAAHLAGSVNVPMQRIGAGVETILSVHRPIVVIAAAGDAEPAARRLMSAGFPIVAVLEGDLSALAAWPDLVRRTIRVSAQTVGEQLAGGRSPLVIDVRSDVEWRAEHVAGSLCVPLGHLRERMHLIPYSHVLVMVSGTGHRSSAAASLLQAHGVADVLDLVGGMRAWKSMRLPTVSEDAVRCGARPDGTRRDSAGMPAGARSDGARSGARFDRAGSRSEPEPDERRVRVGVAPRKFELGGALCVDLEQRIARRHHVAKPTKQPNAG